ncbi:hypothetical protein V8C86DRAFT_2940621 [Haematococcus lacustris]
MAVDINRLSNELWVLITGNLDIFDACRLSCTCRATCAAVVEVLAHVQSICLQPLGQQPSPLSASSSHPLLSSNPILASSAAAPATYLSPIPELPSLAIKDRATNSSSGGASTSGRARGLRVAVAAPARRDSQLAYLALHCTRLAHLDLRHCFAWVAGPACQLLSSLASPDLHSLILAHCQLVGQPELRQLCSGPSLRQGLTHLDLSSIRGLRDVSCLASLKALTWLDLSWTNVATEPLLAVAGQLTSLRVKGCDAVHDPLCAGLAAAQDLDLSFTAITDAGLHSLAAAAPALRHLILALDVPNIHVYGAFTQPGVRQFRQQRPDVAVSMLCA